MRNAEDLRRLSTLLDEALDLPPALRESWLASLPEESAALEPALRDLLAKASKETDELIDHGPRFAAPAAEPEPERVFRTGDTVGPYRLLRPLGQGGMGEVWLAERSDGQLQRPVALKLPTLGLRRSVLVQRFARERDILGALTHPHIARLYDAGVAADDQPFLALEYVDGIPITHFAEAHHLGPRQVVELLLQVMDAVQYAHANLVVHRDLKPSNVLVTHPGQAMLLDFGIAKLLQDEGRAEETELTRIGGRALTLAYAAPEQITGQPVSIATDVWALGVLLYELLTGERPFVRATPLATEQAVLAEDPARPAIDADLAPIVLKALKKPPEQRYATVNALAEDLRRWLKGEPVLARPDSAAYRLRKFVARHKAAVAGATAVATIVIGASAVSIHQARVAREQTRVAQTEARTARAVESFLEGILRSNSGDQADPLKARQRSAQELLEEGARRIATELDDAPQAKLKVLDTLSDMFEDTDRFSDAAQLQTQRAELAAKVDGPGSPKHVHALARKAHLLTTELRLDQAAAALAEAKAAAAQGSPDDDGRIALGLAQAWYARHTNPSAGLEPIAAAIELLRHRPPSALLVQALDQHGSLLALLNRPADALVLLQESAALAADPAYHADSTLSGTLIMIGNMQTQQGQFAAAERSLRQAVDQARRHHGERSESRMVAEVMLSQFLGNQGRPHEAIVGYSQALELLRSMPATSHRDSLLASYVAIGARSFIFAGRYDKLLALIDEALAVATPDSPGPSFLAALENARATVYQHQGQWGEADKAMAQARRTILGEPNMPEATRNDWMRISVLSQVSRGRLEAAQATLDEWLTARRAAGKKDVEAMDGRYLACVLLVARGNGAQALPRCEDAMAYTTPAAERCHCATRADEVGPVLAEAQMLSGQPEAAVKTLRSAIALLQQRLGPEPGVGLLKAQGLLAQALVATGDAAGAREALAAARTLAAAHQRLAPDITEPMRAADRALAGRR